LEEEYGPLKEYINEPQHIENKKISHYVSPELQVEKGGVVLYESYSVKVSHIVLVQHPAGEFLKHGLLFLFEHLSSF